MRGTYFLESEVRGISEDMKSKRENEGYSLPGECKGRQVRIQKKASELRRTHQLKSEGKRQVRTREESERARGTHSLESAW